MLARILGVPTPIAAQRFRTFVLLAALESSLLSRLVTRLKRRAVPEREKRPEAHGSGRYDRLDVGEEGRYAVVAGHLGRLARNGRASVLDVGCGPGILQSYLSLHGYGRYLGIDFAADNVARASARSDDRTSFEVADATVYQPRGAYDLIVFNEVLYYFVEDSVACVRRYMRHLEPGGVVVVSTTVDYATIDHIRTLRAGLPVIDEYIVVNRIGFGWVIQAIGEGG
jgi:2-polyprenyl-3-methyl-5-hydroxy-6-metoxy-1,4-benzoquinol methylase